MRLLVGLSVCHHLFAGEVLPGLVIPGGCCLDCIVMKLEVHRFQYSLESKHNIQHDFTIMPDNATVLEGRGLVLPKLHKHQEIVPPLQTSRCYIFSLAFLRVSRWGRQSCVSL